MCLFARVRRSAIVASGTRKWRAMSCVDIPQTRRSVNTIHTSSACRMTAGEDQPHTFVRDRSERIIDVASDARFPLVFETIRHDRL